jgi:hypothetical protein
MSRVPRLLLLSLLLAPASAQAAMLGDASVPYSAERTVTVNGKSYTGMVFHTPGHDRHEQAIAGIAEVFILDADSKQGYLIVPEIKSYVAFAMPRLMAELDQQRLRGAAVGHERVAGVETTKYRIDYTAEDGSRAEGFVWVGARGVLMRIDGQVTRNNGKPTSLHMELANLALGPQPPDLFTVPPGLLRLPSQALESFLGGKRG